MSAYRTNSVLSFFLAATLLGSGGAFAAGSHSGGHGHDATMPFGEPGNAADISRTIEILMGDNYFEPERLAIAAGETIRFVIRNDGDFLHEFNLGTAAMHAAHQEEMMTMMQHGMLTPTGIDHDRMMMDHGGGAMAHDDANSVLVEPGQSAELIWKFSAATGLEFACNIPGHYDAGMVGEVNITQPAGSGS